MNVQASGGSDIPNDLSSIPSVTGRKIRPFYWSVRRELWENRSLYIAPMIAAGVILLGFGITAINLPRLRQNALLLDPIRQRAVIEQPYNIAATMIALTAFVVGLFYCLDALYGERRDRSILFWKSLPVSDLISVSAKLSVPIVILPVVTFVIVELTHLIMLLVTSLALLPSGLAGTTLPRLSLFHLATFLFYGLMTSALWQAPIFGWLLLVSAWARRAVFLWAVLPWAAICMVEKIAFDSTRFARLLGHRIVGSLDEAFVVINHPHHALPSAADRVTQLDPLKFIGSPGLWIGFLIAATFVAGAIRLRRERGPL